MKSAINVVLALLGLFLLVTPAQAAAVCSDATVVNLGGGAGEREACLGGVEAALVGHATTGTGNATAATLNAGGGLGGFTDWVEVASVEPADGTSGMSTDGELTIDVTSGVWGGKMVSGDWSITGAFPGTDFAISIHVGNGGDVEPDHYIWYVATGAPLGPLSGDFAVDGFALAGGGLSNIKAYSRDGDPMIPVPEPSSLLLSGMGLLAGVALLRRKIRH